MRIGNGLGWKGAALLLGVGLAACGGGAEREHGTDDDSLTGPSAGLPAATPTPDAGTPTPQPTPTATPAPATTPAAVTVAYEQDVRPILVADCLGCHGTFGTYAGTMDFVVPGDANSPLVRATQAGGSMNRHLAGDRAAKAELIRAWVVENGAAQRR
jgi:hypothetical protein